MSVTINSIQYTDLLSGDTTSILATCVGARVRIEIDFDATLSFNYIRYFYNFLDNGSSIDSDSGGTDDFSHPSTNDTQSFYGLLGVLSPNNAKTWRKDNSDFSEVVTVTDNGSNNYTISHDTIVTPLLIEAVNDDNTISSDNTIYAGADSVKYIFGFDCFVNEIDVESVESFDLGDLFDHQRDQLGNVGFFDEYLNGLDTKYDVFFRDISSSSTIKLRKDVTINNAVFELVFLKNIDTFDTSKTLLENYEYLSTNGNTIFYENLNSVTNLNELEITFDLKTEFFNTDSYCFLLISDDDFTSSEAHFISHFTLSDTIENNVVEVVNNEVKFKYYADSTEYTELKGFVEDKIISKFDLRFYKGVTSLDTIDLVSSNLVFYNYDNEVTRVELPLTDAVIDNGLLTYDSERKEITATVTDETTNNYSLRVIDNTLVRYDGLSFVTDGFAVGDSVAITGDIVDTKTVSNVSDSVITFETSFDDVYNNSFKNLLLDAVDYSLPSSLARKTITYSVPFEALFSTFDSFKNVNTVKVECELLKTNFDTTTESINFEHIIDSFFSDYDTDDTWNDFVDAEIVLKDVAESVVLGSTPLKDDDTRVVAIFTKTGLASDINVVKGIFHINDSGSNSKREFGTHIDNLDSEFVQPSGLETLYKPHLRTLGSDSIELVADLDYLKLRGKTFNISAYLKCGTSVFNDLLSNAILIHSKDQEIISASKYIDKNGVVNSPVDIFKIYNQLNEGTGDLITQQPDDDLNLVNNAFEFNDLTSVVRSFLTAVTGYVSTEMTSMVDIQSVQSNNIFLTWTFLAGGFFRLSKNISGGVDLYDFLLGTVATSIFDITSAKHITVTVASNNDVDIYVDAVLTYSYNRTGTYSPFNGFLIGANNSRNEIVFSKHFAWDTVLTQSQIASIINEKY